MAKSILIVGHDADEFRTLIRAKFPNLAVHAAMPDQAAGEALDASALFGFSNKLTDELVARMKNLEWIQFLSSGTDALHRMPSLKPEVFVTSSHGVHGPPVAEMALLHMMLLARDYPRFYRQQQQGQWTEYDQPLLHKKTVTVLGVGLIAQELALRCKAFDMTVLGVSSMPRQVPGFDKIYARSELKTAVGLADFFVLLVPLSPATENMVNADVLAAMRPSAYLVNMARGGVVDEEALMAALRAGTLAGAGLDAFRTEPLPPDHPFWRTERVIITPHCAGRSDSYAAMVAPIFLKNIDCFMAGRLSDMINITPH